MLSGTLLVQVRGKGEFASAHVQLEDSRVTIRLSNEVRCGSTVGIRVSKPKTARQGHPHAFRVDLAAADSGGAAKYILSATSAAEQAKWMKVLRAASKRGPPMKRAAIGPARIGAARSMPSRNTGERHEGILMRRRTPRSDWQQRWVRVDTAGLSIFERKGGNRQDFVPLRDLQEARLSQAPLTRPGDFEMEVLSKETTWRLRALSADELDEWIVALSHAISKVLEGQLEASPSSASTVALRRSILGAPHLGSDDGSMMLFQSSPGELSRAVEGLWGTSSQQVLRSVSRYESKVRAGGVLPRADSAGAVGVSTRAGRAGGNAGTSSCPERATAGGGASGGIAKDGGAPLVLGRTKSEQGAVEETADRAVLRRALQDNALFEPLAADRTGASLSALVMGAEVVSLGAGRVLYTAGVRGHAAECAYVVATGTIVVTPAAKQDHSELDLLAAPLVKQSTHETKATQPQILKSGALFGVEALLCDAPRCATAVAGGDTSAQIWAIQRDLFSATASAAASSSAKFQLWGEDQGQWGGGTSCAEAIAHQLHLTYPAFSFLRRVKLFASLTIEELGSIAAVMTELPCSRGQPLLIEGERSRGLFIVRTGKVIVRRSAQEIAVESSSHQRSKSSPSLGRESNSTSHRARAKHSGAFQRSVAEQQTTGNTSSVLAQLFPGEYFGDRELRGGTAASNTIEGGSDGGRLLWLSPADFKRLLATQEDLPWRAVSPWDAGHIEVASSLTWRVEEFEKLGQLGAGAFGQVIAVRERQTGQLYALKALNKRHLIKEDAVDLVYQERDMLAEVGHSRFVCGLRGYTQDASRLYFLLELCTAGDVRGALSRQVSASGGVGGRGFSLETVRRIGAELTLALEHIHRHHVVYRDLKPENALVTADGHVKLTDFGLARNLLPGERTFTHAGTDPYMPPELLQHLGTGTGMDWWALGIMMFELRIGCTPFELLQRPKDTGGFEQTQHIFYLIMKREPQFPAWLQAESPSFVDLIAKLLCKEYTTRLGNGAAGPEEVKEHAFFAEENIDWSAATSHDCNELSWPAIPGLGGQTEAEQLAAVTDSAHGLRTEALAGQHGEGKVTEKEQRLFDDFSGYWEEEDATSEAQEGACTVQ